MDDERFTEDALRQMAEQLPGKPVTANFDRGNVIGRVISAEVTDEGLGYVLEMDRGTQPRASMSLASSSAMR